MTSVLGDDPNTFLADYKSEGGWYNEQAFGLAAHEGMGIGGLALQDIDAEVPVFHTPLKYLLTPYTSDLRSKLSAEHWDELDRGWNRLILVMMYETEKGDKSPWYKYLRSLPVKFTSPMHWTDEERGYLKGTTVANRVGREEAEQGFQEVMIPIIKANPELFPADSTNFNMEAFHLQGSRILSRSFTIPRRRADPELWSQPKEAAENEDEDSDDEEEEEGEAVMIPMADMLNAGCNMGNVHLFGDEDMESDEGVKDESLKEQGPGYTMCTTRAIQKGEQIFNDYGEPANWELLRRFGHVDTVELPQEILDMLQEDEIKGYKLGNPGDEVVFDLDDIVKACHAVTGKALDKLEKRAEWWEENGEEDTFHFSYEAEIDEPLLSFIRLLVYDFEWSRTRKTGEVPAASLDSKVAKVLEQFITTREAEYTGDMESDLKIVNEATDSLRDALTMATIVRLGERRILRITRRLIQTELAEAEEEEKAAEKRKAEKGEGKVRQVKRGKMKMS